MKSHQLIHAFPASSSNKKFCYCPGTSYNDINPLFSYSWKSLSEQKVLVDLSCACSWPLLLVVVVNERPFTRQTSLQLRFFWQPLNPIYFLFSPHLVQCCAHRMEWQLWIQQSPGLGIDQGEYFHSSILKTLVSTQLLPHRLPIISALVFFEWDKNSLYW